MSEINLFTSESVSEGHPDKLADQISDAVLDELLKQDATSRVALETFLTRGLAVVGGELTTSAYVEIADVVGNPESSPPGESVIPPGSVPPVNKNVAGRNAHAAVS